MSFTVYRTIIQARKSGNGSIRAFHSWKDRVPSASFMMGSLQISSAFWIVSPLMDTCSTWSCCFSYPGLNFPDYSDPYWKDFPVCFIIPVAAHRSGSPAIPFETGLPGKSCYRVPN